jgi:methylmalonyl-CoA mutase
MVRLRACKTSVILYSFSMSKPLDPWSFSTDTTEAWKTRVERELKGKSFEDHLIWQEGKDFTLSAWQNSQPSPMPVIPVPHSPWIILEPVYASDAQEANRRALDALMTGAEGIWFHKGFLGAAAEVATKNIDQSIAPVFIQGNTCADPYYALLKTGEQQEPACEHILLNGKRMRERGAQASTEIALLLSQAIEHCQQRGFDAHILFWTASGTAFLTELSKHRALRWLWSNILRQEGVSPKSPQLLSSNLGIDYAYNDEHSNILRATSSAMASILGGASMVMIEPWDMHRNNDLVFSQRISRNIQLLLKEEARLDKNLNAPDGAYLIEHLTVALAEKAWNTVQLIEQQGGFTAFAQSGQLLALLSTEAEEMKQAYAKGQRILLGVNKYPPKPVKTESSPSTSSYALLPDFIHLPSYLQHLPS